MGRKIEEREVGFWAEGKWDNEKGKWIPRKDTSYPMPKEERQSMHSKKKFVKKLIMLQKAISCGMIDGMEKRCKGWSNCRLCGERNGTITYEYMDWNVTGYYFKWTEGLTHYVEDHNVYIDDVFVAFVLNTKALEDPEVDEPPNDFDEEDEEDEEVVDEKDEKRGIKKEPKEHNVREWDEWDDDDEEDEKSELSELADTLMKVSTRNLHNRED